MRGAVLLAATAVAALSAACATTVDVTFDDAQDFSHYRTWDWLPDGRSVDALPGEERGLDALTSRLIDRELRGRGLERADDEADLLVGYELRVRRYVVTANETGATTQLSSHHHSLSYLIQSTTKRIDVYDVGHLRVVVTDRRRERLVWQGELRARRPE